MVSKLSFETTLEICTALGQFADARSKLVPDIDLILVATKVDGRDSLTTGRLSEMKWYQRAIRWLGFGNATPSKVARVLHDNEPELPRCFSSLTNGDVEQHYYPQDLPALRALTKERFKKLRNDKIRGCERFLNCLSNHNTKHRFGKVYIELREHEKIDFSISTCHPVGLLPNVADEGAMMRKFKAPHLDPEQFKYLDPASFRKDKIKDPNVLGFCYEYGLGVKKDHDIAFTCYETAAKTALQPSFASSYNLGRMLLCRKKFHEAISELSELKTALESRLKKDAEIRTQLNERKAKLQNSSWKKADKAHLLHTIDDSLAKCDKSQKTCEKLFQKTLDALAKALEGCH